MRLNLRDGLLAYFFGRGITLLRQLILRSLLISAPIDARFGAIDRQKLLAVG